MKLLHLIFRKQYINHSTISIPNLVIMKRIEIIIPDSKLEHAHVILKDVNSGGMSAYTVEGSGRIKSERIIVGRGTAQTQPEYVPRTKVEVVVKDHQLEQLVSKLTNTLGSELGGKIFALDVPIAVDIRTRKTGEDAI
ncbi:MAG: P-II family nitrogen regulator [Candidatus Nitrosopolaris sp.]